MKGLPNGAALASNAELLAVNCAERSKPPPERDSQCSCNGITKAIVDLVYLFRSSTRLE